MEEKKAPERWWADLPSSTGKKMEPVTQTQVGGGRFKAQVFPRGLWPPPAQDRGWGTKGSGGSSGPQERRLAVTRAQGPRPRVGAIHSSRPHRSTQQNV